MSQWNGTARSPVERQGRHLPGAEPEHQTEAFVIGAGRTGDMKLLTGKITSAVAPVR
jgi:hypothetical protein